MERQKMHYPLTKHFPAIEEVITEIVYGNELTPRKLKWTYRKSTDSYSFKIRIAKHCAVQRSDVVKIMRQIVSHPTVKSVVADHSLRSEFAISSKRAAGGLELLGADLTFFA